MARYATQERRGSVAGCGHTVAELRRLQAYRLAHRGTFTTQDGSAAAASMRVLSTLPQELLSRPKLPYTIQSYRVDEGYGLQRMAGPDPTLRADRPPLVHAMPWGARHVRVSVPGRVGRALGPDRDSTSNARMRHRSKAPRDESLSIYATMRPGRSLPDHICKPKVCDRV